MRLTLWLPVSVCAFVAFGCDEVSTDRVTGNAGTRPRSAISDGANKGNGHFFFLPPIVSSPSYSGSSDGALKPNVEVCDVGPFVPTLASQCDVQVASFQSTGVLSETTVAYDAAAQQYHVNWRTDSSSPSIQFGHYYRIKVKVAGTVLGFADVTPVAGQNAVRNAKSGDVIPFADGRTLPIKFRIEQGAIAVIGTSGGTAMLANGAVALTFPAGAAAGTLGVTASPIPAGTPGSDASVIPGTLYEFQPSPTSFAQPVTLTVGYPSSLPFRTHPDRLVLCEMIGDACVPVPGSTSNVAAHTVTGNINSFSEYGVTEFPEIARTLNYGLGYQANWNLRTPSGDVALIPGNASFLSWAPDGSRLVYSGPNGLNVVNGDGSGQTTLRAGECFQQLDWAPVGDRIAYQVCFPAEYPGAEYAVYSIKSDGTDRRAYPGATSYVGAQYLLPRFSPDGKWIVFVGTNCSSGSRCISVINVDGTGRREVVVGGFGQVGGLSWSADGTRLAFSAYDNATGDPAIWTVRADGTGLVQVVTDRFLDDPGDSFGNGAEWSPAPGSDLILFHTQRNETHVIHADGTGERLLAPGLATREPTWSRNGGRIGFVIQDGQAGTLQVHTINVDGTGLQRLAPDVSAGEYFAIWRP